MELKPGDVFEFGIWESMPIAWRVLEKKDKGILCLSEYVLANHVFDNGHGDWKKSSLRQWLNFDFYSKAFSEKEKSFLLPCSSISYLTAEDKVSLLDDDEGIDKYFKLIEDRKAKDRSGAFKWWWLLSFIENSFHVSCVSAGGNIYQIYKEDISGAVRPIIFLKKEIEDSL